MIICSFQNNVSLSQINILNSSVIMEQPRNYVSRLPHSVLNELNRSNDKK